MRSHGFFQRTTALMTGAACVLAMLPAAIPAVAAYNVTSVTTNGRTSSNVGKNDYTYSNWSAPMTSYLVETARGYTRVEFISGSGVLVEDFTADGSLTSSRVITAPLPDFGGFFAGSDAYFLVFGEEDPDEILEKEVLRVVKYDKNWNFIGSIGLNGLNSVKNFDAGSLRMTETNGILYLHTSHKMFAIEGYNHQSNMSLGIRESDMGLVDYQVNVVKGYGYVSHSFNQFVCADGAYLYRVDQGDYYPRAVVLQKNAILGDGKLDTATSLNILEIGGSYVDNSNFTGVTVGGMELSQSNVLSAGTSIDQSQFPAGVNNLEQNENGGQHNVFLNIADKGLGGSRTIWLTSYGSSDDIEVGTPQLVKCKEDRFLLLWEEQRGAGRMTRSVAVDGSGNIVSEVHDEPVRLSDCKPIYTSKGKVVWYVTVGTAPTVYTLTPDLGLPEEDEPDPDGNVTCKVSFVDDVTGAPVSGATLRVHFNDSTKPEELLTSDDNGMVEFTFAPNGSATQFDGYIAVVGVPAGYEPRGYDQNYIYKDTTSFTYRLIPTAQTETTTETTTTETTTTSTTESTTTTTEATTSTTELTTTTSTTESTTTSTTETTTTSSTTLLTTTQPIWTTTMTEPTTTSTTATTTETTTSSTTATTATTPTQTEPLRGDSDQDGDVDAADASEILVYSTRKALYGWASLFDDWAKDQAAKTSANVNRDSEINAVDASIILVYCTQMGVGRQPDWDALCQ